MFMNETKADKPLQIKFTDEQKKELKELAKSRNMKMGTMIKRLLDLEKEYGVIALFNDSQKSSTQS